MSKRAEQIEGIKELIKSINDKEMEKYLNSDIYLDDINSTYKVLHHLKNDRVGLDSYICLIEEEIRELYDKHINEAIRKEEAVLREINLAINSNKSERRKEVEKKIQRDMDILCGLTK